MRRSGWTLSRSSVWRDKDRQTDSRGDDDSSLSLFISSLHVQFVTPEHPLQRESLKWEITSFCLSLFDVFTLWLCDFVCSCGRDVCYCLCVCVYVFPSSLFLSVEEKWGRQLAEIEGNDCDLRTASRAKCFLSLLFSLLFSTFGPGCIIFLLLLRLLLSSAPQIRAFHCFPASSLLCGSKPPSIGQNGATWCTLSVPCQRTALCESKNCKIGSTLCFH